jgi:formylglycine-generating enzyme required for sulfatase activity
MSSKSLIRLAALAAVTSLAVSTASAQITIPTVTIGNPGNAPDTRVMLDGTSGYGAVAYTYNIGVYEVTNAEYAAFLRAKAASDPFGLYEPAMAGPYGGIVRSGSPGSYTYVAVRGRAGNPVNFVSFWDACRFANWLHNGQGDGDTETGAYTLGGVANPVNTSVTRNAGWKWAVTSENEWYKAAYHQPALEMGDSDDYWLYPTSSNTISTAQANYNSVIGDTTPVGSYAANYYGTFDMAGNVWEWNEAIISGRGVRGGAFDDLGNGLLPEYRGTLAQWYDFSYGFGFRVVQNPAPPCPADFDNSGFLDSDDFILYVSQFVLGCTGPGIPDLACIMNADFDNSGFVDSDDFIAYVAAFDAGC